MTHHNLGLDGYTWAEATNTCVSCSGNTNALLVACGILAAVSLLWLPFEKTKSIRDFFWAGMHHVDLGAVKAVWVTVSILASVEGVTRISFPGQNAGSATRS